MMESEIGRIPVHVQDDLASSLQPKERILSLAFLEASAFVCTNLSYRAAADTLNRFLHRTGENAVKLKTLSDSMQRIGGEISKKLISVTEKTLATYGFNSETGLPMEGVVLSENITEPIPAERTMRDLEELQNTIDAINNSREEMIPYSSDEVRIESSLDSCVYISVDDIGVKHQKESRAEGTERKYKFVENTVAHIQYGENAYVLTAIGMRNAFKSILAFLLANNLLSQNLIFLTDGAKDIKSHIETVFSFHSYSIILDWHHLKKKCMELLSMSIRGKDKRNQVLEKLLRFLWVGDVSSAESYLVSLPESDTKNHKWLGELSAYLDRKRDCIACYILRDKLGLRNSSNRVEKANDLLVAQRQKHNGMAWSPQGSGALAAIEMVYHNNQADVWFKEKELPLFAPIFSYDQAA